MAKRQHPATEQDEPDVVSDPETDPAPGKPASEPASGDDGARAARAATTTDEPILQKYETIARVWPVDSLTVLVRRVTGAPAEWTVAGQPRTAAELYAAIKVLHGRYEDATYEVTVRDSAMNRNRGSGRITMPDTREEQLAQPQSGPQPMNPPYNPHYPYPQGYPPPPYASAPGYAPQQQQAPAAAGVAGMTHADFMAFQRQQFDMWQAAQRGQAPPQGQPQAQQPAPPIAPIAAPQPVVAGMTHTEFLAMQQQQFEMWQHMQRTGQPAAQPPQAPAAPPPPQPQAAAIPGMFNVPGFGYVPLAKLLQVFGVGDGAQPAAQPQQQPPQPVVQVPEGMFHIPGFGFVPTERLFQVLSGNPLGPPQYRGPGPGYRGRPGYTPDGQQPPYDPRYGQPPPQQPPPPKSMRDQFEEVGSYISMLDEYADRFGRGGAAAPAQPEPPPEDDSPVKVIETGPAKIVINKKDGSARLWETVVSNSPGIFKWVAEQAESIQKAARERELTKQQRQVLPPGYVEVGPGYQPPPGFVAVPEMPPQQQHALPPPPAQVPPPITSPQPAPQRQWDIPGVTR